MAPISAWELTLGGASLVGITISIHASWCEGWIVLVISQDPALNHGEKKWCNHIYDAHIDQMNTSSIIEPWIACLKEGNNA